MEELGDFKKSNPFKEYGTTLICALLGGALALCLAFFISKDLRSGTAPPEAVAGNEEADTPEATDTDALLADGAEDVTDLVGYTLMGERTITNEAGNAYTADFAEDGTVAGTFVPEQMDYRVEMNGTGDMTLIFSKNDSETPFALTYDDSYRIVLSDDTHTYTVE